VLLWDLVGWIWADVGGLLRKIEKMTMSFEILHCGLIADSVMERVKGRIARKSMIFCGAGNCRKTALLHHT